MKAKQIGITLLKILVTIGILGILAGMFGVDIPISAARERARRTICMDNLTQIGNGALRYEINNTNKMQSFQSITKYVKNPKHFVCRSSGHKPGNLSNVDQWTDYKMIIGLTGSSPSNAVMAYCPPENHHGSGGNILFVDGSVEWFDADTLGKIVRKEIQ